MPFLTVTEFYTTRLYELDDRVYRRIERVFARFLGDKTARFMEMHMTKTVAQITCTDFVDVMSVIKIL